MSHGNRTVTQGCTTSSPDMAAVSVAGTTPELVEGPRKNACEKAFHHGVSCDAKRIKEGHKNDSEGKSATEINKPLTSGEDFVGDKEEGGPPDFPSPAIGASLVTLCSWNVKKGRCGRTNKMKNNMLRSGNEKYHLR